MAAAKTNIVFSGTWARRRPIPKDQPVWAGLARWRGQRSMAIEKGAPRGGEIGCSTRTKLSRNFCGAPWPAEGAGGQGGPKNPKWPRSETLRGRSPRQKNQSPQKNFCKNIFVDGPARPRKRPEKGENGRKRPKTVGKPNGVDSESEGRRRPARPATKAQKRS